MLRIAIFRTAMHAILISNRRVSCTKAVNYVCDASTVLMIIKSISIYVQFFFLKYKRRSVPRGSGKYMLVWIDFDLEKKKS